MDGWEQWPGNSGRPLHSTESRNERCGKRGQIEDDSMKEVSKILNGSIYTNASMITVYVRPANGWAARVSLSCASLWPFRRDSQCAKRLTIMSPAVRGSANTKNWSGYSGGARSRPESRSPIAPIALFCPVLSSLGM